jgi:hypothetical protein
LQRANWIYALINWHQALRCKEQTEVMPFQVKIFEFSSKNDPSFFSPCTIYSLAFDIISLVPIVTLRVDEHWTSTHILAWLYKTGWQVSSTHEKFMEPGESSPKWKTVGYRACEWWTSSADYILYCQIRSVKLKFTEFRKFLGAPSPNPLRARSSQ